MKTSKFITDGGKLKKEEQPANVMAVSTLSCPSASLALVSLSYRLFWFFVPRKCLPLRSAVTLHAWFLQKLDATNPEVAVKPKRTKSDKKLASCSAQADFSWMPAAETHAGQKEAEKDVRRAREWLGACTPLRKQSSAGLHLFLVISVPFMGAILTF